MKEQVPTKWITKAEFYQPDPHNYPIVWAVRAFFADESFRVYSEPEVVNAIRDKVYHQMSGGAS